ncbi:MAG: excinuclease ABC subunit UvrB [Candidatus Jacksonbacteria bacterium]
MNFKLQTIFKPSGDQPQAIKKLVQGLKKRHQYQTLLGITGSGKTFTIANVINQIQKPTLVMVHNKTLAAQLCNEFRELFPKNAVEYFVSYYDYYQPEAYLPATDTYIEKEAQINDEIDRLRHSATEALLMRRDVIVVASVSCLFSLGAPKKYESQILKLKEKQKIKRSELMRNLIKLGFTRTTGVPERGQFRVRGDVIELQPARGEVVYRLEMAGDRLKNILTLDPLTRAVKSKPSAIALFPTRHFTALDADKERAIKSIKQELKERLQYFNKHKLLLEAERIKRRTNYDLEMIKNIGYCSGIENYSRHFDGRGASEPCCTLFDYFPKDYLLIIDESHVTIPQLRGMYYGDFARKTALIDNGFRLPSAYDNRPLKFDEFTARVNQCIFTSATPADYERLKSIQIVEQINRPTGLVDPEVLIRPIIGSEPRRDSEPIVKSQIADLIIEVKIRAQKHERTLVTALTKRMAEDLTEHFKEQEIKANYLHSDIQTLDRIRILTDFRKGKFDCLVGVNLLREGLDLPEVTLVAILDADKEGFLRSETSLIQTIGRAARNVSGQVILYADEITGSIKRAVDETNRRRQKQLDYNKKHNITPQTIKRKIRDITKIWGIKEKDVEKIVDLELKGVPQKELEKIIQQKEIEMRKAAKNLEFELAALLRDEIKVLRKVRKK